MRDTYFPDLIARLKNLSVVPQAVTKLFLTEGINVSSILAGLDDDNFFTRFENYLNEVIKVEMSKGRKIFDTIKKIREEFLMFLLTKNDESMEFYKAYLEELLLSDELDKEIKDFIIYIWIYELIESAEKSMILPCGDTARELFKLLSDTEEMSSFNQFSHADFYEEINKNKGSQVVFVLNKTHAFCLLVLPEEESEERACYILQSFIECKMKMGYSVEDWLCSDKVEKINLNIFLEEIGLLCNVSDESHVEEKIKIIERYFYTTYLSEEQKTIMKDFLMHQAFFPEDFTVKLKEEDPEHVASIIESISSLLEVKPEFALDARALKECLPQRVSKSRYTAFAHSLAEVQGMPNTPFPKMDVE